MNREIEIDRITDMTAVAITKVVSEAIREHIADNTIWKERFDWLESEVDSWVEDSREIVDGFKKEGFTAKLIESEAFLDAALHFKKMIEVIKESVV